MHHGAEVGRHNLGDEIVDEALNLGQQEVDEAPFYEAVRNRAVGGLKLFQP
jgi:hypothetical protein